MKISWLITAAASATAAVADWSMAKGELTLKSQGHVVSSHGYVCKYKLVVIDGC